jgi:hypothetical protein
MKGMEGDRLPCPLSTSSAPQVLPDVLFHRRIPLNKVEDDVLGQLLRLYIPDRILVGDWHSLGLVLVPVPPGQNPPVLLPSANGHGTCPRSVIHQHTLDLDVGLGGVHVLWLDVLVRHLLFPPLYAHTVQHQDLSTVLRSGQLYRSASPCRNTVLLYAEGNPAMVRLSRPIRSRAARPRGRLPIKGKQGPERRSYHVKAYFHDHWK